MRPATLSKRFYELVAPDIPSEWDVEEVLEPFADATDTVCEVALSHVPVIWPVSHSLCYDFLRLLPAALEQLSPIQIPGWISVCLDLYETKGLRAAQSFMQNGISDYLLQLNGDGGLAISSVKKQLLPYIRGIAQEELHIATAGTCYTDTLTIFVPEKIDLFKKNDCNFLLYKFMLSFQWGHIHCNSFLSSCSKTEELLHFFDTFAIPERAKNIYQALEAIRVRIFLHEELPGLMRDVSKTLFAIWQEETDKRIPLLQKTIIAKTEALADLLASQLGESEAERFIKNMVTAQDSLQVTKRLYNTLAANEFTQKNTRPFPFQGTFKLKNVIRARRQKEQQMGETLLDLMGTHLLSLPQEKRKAIFQKEQEQTDANSFAESDISMVMDSEFAGTTSQEKAAPLLITINNQEIELPKEIATFTQTFLKEFGHLPANFLESAAGKAGQLMLEQDPNSTPSLEGSSEQEKESYLYDEWDYRRQGYRKNWCTLHCKAIQPVQSPFYHKTLSKYHGISMRLRRQFEMMRSQQHFVKRQREGDDIDFDALVESISDTKAGLSGSERLFVKLQRNMRDIAILFLVDQSNSTSGWVNTASKESLILMAEALEILGDRYGIYGFSGMRRSRCEFFHIKHLDEHYTDQVKERISSITPCEYTRMGPAIRHATKLLQNVDAKTRMIITLSDGKPEDYDDYKGQYAIEDTRHALLEAKVIDIHPFCITIDHHAKEYMKHMYGPANYIFINDVHKLPLRIPEIYRALTS